MSYHLIRYRFQHGDEYIDEIHSDYNETENDRYHSKHLHNRLFLLLPKTRGNNRDFVVQRSLTPMDSDGQNHEYI